MEIKDILKERRKELGLTLLDVAKAVGVSEGTVSRWESGDIENMRRDKISALAKSLDISPSVIMGWEEPTIELNKKDKKEITSILDSTKEQLITSEGLMFDGEPATEEGVQAILDALEVGLAIAKKRNKEKYTPKKYKK